MFEEYIDELFVIINDKKNADDDDKEELAEVQAIKKQFEDILFDAETGEMDEDECEELIKEIMEMKDINDEDDEV